MSKKFLLAVALLLLVLIAVFFAIQKRTKQFEPSRVALIDKALPEKPSFSVIGPKLARIDSSAIDANSYSSPLFDSSSLPNSRSKASKKSDLRQPNYVFRGNNPLLKQGETRVFAYEELKNRFNEILQKRGEKPLGDFYLIDVSLLDFNEMRDLETERKFFENSPQKGQFIHFSTISPGLLLKFTKDSNLVSQKLISRYNQQTTDFLTELHKMATQKLDKPIVVYLHCNAGRDRTGYMVAAYKMLFLAKEMQEVRKENAAEAGRDSKSFYNQAIDSYCHFVAEKTGKTENFCQ